jgi:hypothetical protein
MAKQRQPKPTRPQQFQGVTSSPQFANRLRTAQQPVAAIAKAIAPAGIAPGAVRRRPELAIKGKRGRGR